MMLRKDGFIRHPRLNVEIHVQNVSGRTLQEAIFKRKSPDGNGFDVIAAAKEAELRVDTAHKQILVHMRQCNIVQKDGCIAYVDNKIWPVELPADFLGNPAKQRAMDMTWRELNEYFEKNERDRKELDVKLAEHLAKAGRNPTAAENETQRGLETLRQHHINQMNSIRADWCMRPALALGCLCFALVGCPVGIWFSKSDYLSAFITCFLPIVIIYYPLMFCMYDMGRAGKMPPYLVIFNADLLMLIAGGILFRRLARN
jgi:lipopolysaccharide export system permease protein